MSIAVSQMQKAEGSSELPIAPMIDVVFLLLIYFMVSSTIQKQEADVGFSLPAVVESPEPMAFPDEQIIEIDASGQAWVNGYAYDSPEAAVYEELAAMLARFHQAADASQTVARVTLAPNDRTPHQRIVRVMDACEMAGLRNVSFAVGR